MKPPHCLIIIAAACCLLLANGCKKQESSEWKTLGTRVSLTEFREAFANASGNEIPTYVNDAAVNVRYGQYTKAWTALQKLASDPSLTSEQKKVTSKVMSQVEQLAAKPPPK